MARKAIVVGLGRFGISLAQELDTLGFDVLALDSSDHVIENLQGQLTYMIKGDSTSEAVLRDLGIANYDLGIVAIGSDIQANIMTTILLKTLGVKQVIARSNNTLHSQTLERVGADKVVNPEHDAGVRMAHTLFNPDVQDYLSVASKFGISRVKPPINVVGKTIEESGLGGTRDKYGVSVLAIRRGKDPIIFPAKDESIRENDVLFIAGRDDLLDRMRSEDINT
tara:strand:- start:379 stop:1050 length:672 start_codon:yes stop_codon:yes gene_type:complete